MLKLLRRNRPEYVVIACTLLGTFLRVFRLGELPPGLFWDEAFDGYDVLRVVNGGAWPVFFQGNNGREPLTLYLQALGVWLWGSSIWTLRLVPALIGVLTIPAIYRVSAALALPERRARWVGALAAGLLAISFWHVELSRLSLRIISLPLLSALAIWAFWRAWTGLRYRDYALAGLFVGLALYTYLAARLLPLLLLVFVVLTGILSWVRRHGAAGDLRRHAAGMGILYGTLLVVFVPLGLYFAANPAAFWLRSTSISIFTYADGPAASLVENAWTVLRMFVDRGDSNWRHNLAERPALDLLGLLGFWIGLAAALWYWAKPRSLLLLGWLSANLLSTLLSVEAPHYLRAAGALPAIVILSADGLTRLWERWTPRWGWTPLLAAAVLFGGGLTYHDYFDVWAGQRETFDAFSGPVETLVDRALALSETGSVVLPFRLYGLPNMQYRLATRFPHGVPAVPLAAGGRVTGLVTGGVDRTLVVLSKAGAFVPQPLDDQRLVRLQEQAKSGHPVKGAQDQTLGTEFPIANAAELLPELKPRHAADADFGSTIRMLGYDQDPAVVKPGGKIRVTYYWQALHDVSTDYFVTSNLLDPAGESFGQTILEPESGSYPTSLWRGGAIIADSFDVPVPKTAHAGKYRLEVGLLDKIEDYRLLALTGSRDRLLLDPVTVADAPVDPGSIAHPLAVRAGDPGLMTLVGYDFAESKMRAGEKATVNLYWRAERLVPQDYSLFLHLVDAGGRLVAQQDSAPAGGNAPTSWWQPGDLLRDGHELVLPSDLAAGTYTLEIGVYDAATGTRLSIWDAGGRPAKDRLWPIQVQVMGP